MNRLTAAACAAAAVAAAALAGCGTPITHGTVYRKDYTPGYTYIQHVPQYRQSCTTVGVPERVNGTEEDEEEQSCTSVLTGYLYIPTWVPADYELYVRQDKKLAGWVDVDEGTFDQARIHGHWASQ